MNSDTTFLIQRTNFLADLESRGAQTHHLRDSALDLEEYKAVQISFPCWKIKIKRIVEFW